MLIKKDTDKIIEFKTTDFKSEKVVEDLIDKAPDLEMVLGEELMIIGRQLKFKKVDDIMDLLAIDKQGNLVIIEIKESFYKNSTGSDFQTTKYASYVSDWSLNEIKNQAENYFLNSYNEKINFESYAQKFLDNDITNLNNKQRIIILGSDENQKLNSACRWLKKQGVDISLFQLIPYISEGNDNDSIYIYSHNLISESNKKYGPLLKNQFNKNYHLKNCSPKTKELVEVFIEIIQELYNFSEPNWGHKHFVTFSNDDRIMLEFKANIDNIYVRSSHSILNPVNKQDVIKLLKARLDFPVKDKINFN